VKVRGIKARDESRKGGVIVAGYKTTLYTDRSFKSRRIR